VILTGRIKVYLSERKLIPKHSRTGSRHEKWNDVRVTFHLAMKFLAGVKIRRKDDTMDKLNVFAALKRYLMPLSVSGNGAARISLECKSPTRHLQFFIFAVRSYSPSFSILLAVQSHK